MVVVLTADGVEPDEVSAMKMGREQIIDRGSGQQLKTIQTRGSEISNLCQTHAVTPHRSQAQSDTEASAVNGERVR